MKRKNLATSVFAAAKLLFKGKRSESTEEALRPRSRDRKRSGALHLRHTGHQITRIPVRRRIGVGRSDESSDFTTLQLLQKRQWKPLNIRLRQRKEHFTVSNFPSIVDSRAKE